MHVRDEYSSLSESLRPSEKPGRYMEGKHENLSEGNTV
jgi:hypothetical protein